MRLTRRCIQDTFRSLIRIERPDVHSVEEVVTTALRDAILSGELPPGERLPQERLAEQLRVSRIPLRDALRRLEGEGLVRIGPRRGAEVASLSPDDVREIYEIRIGIEPGMMYRAISALDASAITRLVAMSVHMDELAKKPAKASKARRAFYSDLYAFAGRPRTCKLALGLRDDVQRYHVIAALESSLHDHAALRESISAKDPERAAQVHGDHLRRASADLVDALERSRQ
jgi:DNA-binding GntR family transcriptional regulator